MMAAAGVDGRQVYGSQRAYLEQELEAQRAQTARLELLRAQVAECLSDAEAEQQLEQSWHQRQLDDTQRDPGDVPPPYDAPSFPATSISMSTSRGSMETWGAEQPHVWRRRSSAWSSASADSTDAGLQPKRRAPRQLNPILDDLVAEYSREWDIPLEDAEGFVFPEFVDLEVLSDSVLAAKMQERKRLRRQRRRAATEKARAAARIIGKLRLRQTWVKWQMQHRANAETTRHRTRQKALEQKLRFRFAHRAAAGAFGSWKAIFMGAVAQRASLGRALARIKHAHLASAWTSWKAHYDQVRRAHQLLVSTMRRLQSSKMGACFSTWRDNSRWQCRTRSMGKRVAGRLRNMRLSAVFARWALAVVQSQRIKSIVRSAALRLSNLLLSTAWARWYAQVGRSLNARMAARLVVKRLKNAAVAKAFRGWVRWNQQHKRETGLVQKVVGRLKHRTVSTAFGIWHASARDAVLAREAVARVRKAAERMVRQWIMRSLSEAMRAWRGAIDEILRQRYELTKIALRWHNRQLSNAWLMFCEGCETAWAEREDEVESARQEAKQLAAQEKAVSLLCGRRGKESCRHIMILWLDWAAVSGRLRRLLARGEGHHRERLLRVVLEYWCATTAKLRSLRRLGERLTGRLSEHTMRSALLQWHRGASLVAAARRAEGKLRKFGLSQAALRSRAIFVGWANVVAEKRALRRKLYTGMRRAAAGLQGAAWNTWVDTVGRMVRNRKRVASSVKTIRLKAAMVCLEMWTSFVLRQQDKKAKLRRAALRFARMMMVKTFGAWRERAQVRAQLHKLLGKGSKRQVEQKKSQYYAAWVHVVRATQHYRVVSARIARKARRGMCWESLNGWRAIAAEAARLGATLHRCSMRLAHAKIGSAFNRWLVVVRIDESKHHAAARFAMGAASTRLKMLFHQWSTVTAKCAEHRRQREIKLSKSMRRMVMRMKTLAFECWLELLTTVQQRKEVLAKALHRLKSLETAKAYNKWRGVLLAKKRRQARAVHALLVANTRLRLRRVGQVFRPWIAWTRARKVKRAMLRKGLRRCSRVALRHYISVWNVQAKQGKQATVAIRKLLHRHLVLSFEAWSQLVERKRAGLRMLLSILARLADEFIIRRVFLRWTSCVQRWRDAGEQPARVFRPALAGLSPNLAARYREIVGENEFVQHPAVSPGLRDHSPRPTSPLRHVDVRSSGSDYSLRGSGEGSRFLRGSSAIGSPTQSSLSAGSPSSTGIGSTMSSAIADWSLEQLASAASPPLPSQQAFAGAFGSSVSPRSSTLSNSMGAGSLSGSRDSGRDRPGTYLATFENHPHLPSATGSRSTVRMRAHSLEELNERGSAPQSSAPKYMQQAKLPLSSLAPQSRWVQSGLSAPRLSASSIGTQATSIPSVDASLATTASGASYDGSPPTSALPQSAPPQLTSAELWLQQRRSRGHTHGLSSRPAVPITR